MRLYIDNHYFISVIYSTENQHYSCQVMELLHGVGMLDATFEELDSLQNDIVSSRVVSGFSEVRKYCQNMAEIFKFHETCLKQLKKSTFPLH